jgi:hypothetical protein
MQRKTGAASVSNLVPQVGLANEAVYVKKKNHTRNDDILIIIYDSCPIMSLLRRRLWSAARIIWILRCAIR